MNSFLTHPQRTKLVVICCLPLILTASGNGAPSSVEAAAPAISMASLPDGQVGVPYQASLPAQSPHLWRVVSGRLPRGLSLSLVPGQISGTPSESGQFSVVFQAVNSLSPHETSILSYSLKLKPDPIVTLDLYGGLASMPSPNQPTAYFRMEKFGNRWMFVDPANNAFWQMGIFVIDTSTAITDQGTSYAQIIARKYPDKPTWANQAITRIHSWGFNAVGEESATYVYPFGRPAGAQLAPMVPTARFSRDGLTNRNNYGPGPFKSLADCLNPAVYTGYQGGSTPDVFDPNFDAFVDGQIRAALADPFWRQPLTSPWVIGTSPDEGDDVQGIGPGLEIPGTDGVVSVHIGWLSLACAPIKTSSSRYGVTFSNPTVFSKQHLIHQLQTKYGTIQALNAAWGSKYSTFLSGGGWPKSVTGGSGLMDEDGSSAWLGDRDGTLRNSSAGVTADLDTFLLAWARKYFQVTAGRLRQYSPKLLVFSPSTFNSHGGLTRRQILQAAGEYCDVLRAGVLTQQLLDKTAQYAGDKPISQWLGVGANPDSSLWRYPNPLSFFVSTQAQRGAQYANWVQYLARAKVTATGRQPIVGFEWFAWLDSWGEKANWGLVSFRDNAYDGKEAVITPGKDSWGYATGGEERNYGDFITPVKTANLSAMQHIVSSPQ